MHTQTAVNIFSRTQKIVLLIAGIGFAICITGIIRLHHQPVAGATPTAQSTIQADLPHLGATIEELTQLLGKPSSARTNSQEAVVMWFRKPDPSWNITANCIAGRCLRITYTNNEGALTDTQIRFLSSLNKLEGITRVVAKKSEWVCRQGTTIRLMSGCNCIQFTHPAFNQAVEALKAEQAGRASQLPKF